MGFRDIEAGAVVVYAIATKDATVDIIEHQLPLVSASPHFDAQANETTRCIGRLREWEIF